MTILGAVITSLLLGVSAVLGYGIWILYQIINYLKNSKFN